MVGTSFVFTRVSFCATIHTNSALLSITCTSFVFASNSSWYYGLTILLNLIVHITYNMASYSETCSQMLTKLSVGFTSSTSFGLFVPCFLTPSMFASFLRAMHATSSSVFAQLLHPLNLQVIFATMPHTKSSSLELVHPSCLQVFIFILAPCRIQTPPFGALPVHPSCLQAFPFVPCLRYTHSSLNDMAGTSFMAANWSLCSMPHTNS